MTKINSEFKYQVRYSTKFKSNYKKIIKQGKDIDKLKMVIKKLANKESLSSKYKDHALIDNKKYKNCRDCHIEPDWILIYKYVDNELVLLLINTGSHSRILNK